MPIANFVEELDSYYLWKVFKLFLKIKKIKFYDLRVETLYDSLFNMHLP